VLLLVMTITTVALLLTAVALFAWDYSQFRTDIQRELFTQARIVLENSTAAMSFRDAEAARETLETLAPNNHILLGCLYTVTGSLFAEFRPDQDAACPAAPPPYGQQLHEDSADVSISTEVGGRPAGSIYLRSDLEAVTDRVRVQAATAAAVLVLSLVVALLLSSSLQRIISEPINALARTARDVSQHDDYSLRATKSTDDELGVLVDAFNSMLGEIERSERERASLLRS
jgi:methyl-accepting chemotaxis protein